MHKGPLIGEIGGPYDDGKFRFNVVLPKFLMTRLSGACGLENRMAQ